MSIKDSPASKMSNTPKSKFTLSEDAELRQLVHRFGESDWELISKTLGTKNSRQCHDRWFYILSPRLNKTPWTDQEDNLLMYLITSIGPHWVKMSKYFSGRTDTQLKNRYKILNRRLTHDFVCYLSENSSRHEVKSVKASTSNIQVQCSSSPEENQHSPAFLDLDSNIFNDFDSLFDIFE